MFNCISHNKLGNPNVGERNWKVAVGKIKNKNNLNGKKFRVGVTLGITYYSYYSFLVSFHHR
jgi:hypothetical protein